MNKSKLSAILSLAFVFVSGAVLGAFAYRLYSASPVSGTLNAPAPPPPKKGPEEYRKWYVSTLSKELKLDAAQLQQLNGILDTTRDEFAKLDEKYKADRDALREKTDAFNAKVRPEREAIHTHQVDQINAILRDDQRAAYASFRAERERQRRIQRDHKKQ
jgi:hypothetical protein